MPKELLDLLRMPQENVRDYIVSHFGAYLVDEEPLLWFLLDPYPEIKDKPLVCVHLDTVNKGLSVYKEDLVHKDDMISLNTKVGDPLFCLGGDDRAGVYVALQLLRSLETNKTPYAFAFFWDEEIGCIGSHAFTETPYIHDYGCFIGLDRRSTKRLNEVATYEYDNDDLIDIFTSHGFIQTEGLLTDASIISEELSDDKESIACVNLSVGFDHEHTRKEVIYLDNMRYTLYQMRAIDIPRKKWDSGVPDYTMPNFGWSFRGKQGAFTGTSGISDDFMSPDIPHSKPVLCDFCYTHKTLYETDTGDMLCSHCIGFLYS